MQGHARCTHVQVASATLGYITKTLATQLATNTVIIFLLYNGCLLLCPYRLWHMRPRSIGLIPSLSANAKLSKVEQNTHMAMQIRCTVCPNIADNPPLPQPCKEVLHPCTIQAMNIIILLLVVTQSFPTNIRYSGVQAAPNPNSRSHATKRGWGVRTIAKKKVEPHVCNTPHHQLLYRIKIRCSEPSPSHMKLCHLKG